MGKWEKLSNPATVIQDIFDNCHDIRQRFLKMSNIFGKMEDSM